MKKGQYPKLKQEKGYFIIVPDKVNDDWSLSALCISKEGTIIKDIYVESVNKPDSLSFLDEWGMYLEEYKVITMTPTVYFEFLNDAKSHLSIYSYRMFKSRLWNLYNEILYQLRLPRTLSIEDILFLYGYHPPKHSISNCNQSIQLYYLVQIYLYDKKQTQKLITKKIEDILTDIFERYSIEEIIALLRKMNYQIMIQTITPSEFQIEACTDTSHHSILSPSLHKGLVEICAKIHVFKWHKDENQSKKESKKKLKSVEK